MKQETNEESLVAPCGLDCARCPIYLATTDRVLAERIAQSEGRPVEEIHCAGCRVDLSQSWVPNCATYECCVNQKGLGFCYECEDFPCPKIAPFRNSPLPHNIKLYNLLRMQKVGLSKWVKEEAEGAYHRYFKGKLVCPGEEPQ